MGWVLFPEYPDTGEFKKMLTLFFKAQNLTNNHPSRLMKPLPPSGQSFDLPQHSADESRSYGNHPQAPSNESNIKYDDLVTEPSSADDEDRKKSKDNPAANPSSKNHKNKSAQDIISLTQPVKRINVSDERLFDRLPHHQRPEDFESYSMKKSQVVIYFFNGHFFSGTITESVRHLIMYFEQCGDQFLLWNSEKEKYFPNALEPPSHDFFLHKGYPVLLFFEMVHLIQTEYDSYTRQKTIQDELECLHLHPFMSENDMSPVSDGLEKIVDRIITLILQALPLFRSEQHKMSQLRADVQSSPWENLVIGQLSTS